MYYSEFTLKLIDEVKKREILYNTKYEKRPKAEKEGAWKEIAKELTADSERVKKHWKNIRDRYVKVMHQRDKHFANGGTELNAPQYIYFDKLNFMRAFSIQKDPHVDLTVNVSVSSTISPDHLFFEEFKESTGETVVLDYTDQFLEHIKRFPVLFDHHAEMRKYRSKEAWKQLSDLLGGKFTVGRLRHYWMTLIKKYSMYLQNTHSNCDPIENEGLFENLSFANVGLKMKQEENLNGDIQFIMHTDEMDSSQEYFDELNEEEHLLCEEVDDEVPVESEAQEREVEAEQAVDNIEEINEPESKKLKIEPKTSVPDLKSFKLPDSCPQVQEIFTPPSPPVQSQTLPTTHEDEFDYFGKKVALQLRNIALKNRSVSRKGEIKVLQLLMELEESLES